MYEKMYKENYIAVAIHMTVKSSAEISPLHKVYVNVTSGKRFYNIQNYYKNH